MSDPSVDEIWRGRAEARLDALEREVTMLREARHDHANKLSGLGMVVEYIKATLASITERLSKVESAMGDLARSQETLHQDVSSLRLRLGRVGSAGILIYAVLELVLRVGFGK